MKNVLILASALALSVTPMSGEALFASAAAQTRASQAASKTDPDGTYRVVKGDTVEAIAKRFDMSQAELIALNGLERPYRLGLGKVLKVTPTKTSRLSSRIDVKADQASMASASTYRVVKGDTLGAIANRTGVSQADLIELNGLARPYALKLGQVLTLTERQAATAQPKAESAASSYKVVKGDTLGLIAKRLKVSQDDLIALNDLKAPYALSLGKVLKVPGQAGNAPSVKSEAKSATVAEASETPSSYKVVSGDTLGLIAKRLKVSQSEIIALNGLKKPYALKSGRILKVPGSAALPERARAEAPPAIEISTKSYSSLPKNVQGGKGTYKVVKGDTVVSVARRLGMDPDDLIQMNGLKRPYALTRGKVLKVPAPMVYEVQSGDTFSDIANRFDVSVSDLTRLNKTAAAKGLRPGQKIKLPPEVQARLAAKAEAAERAAQQAAANRAEAARFEAEQDIIRREAARLANERALAAKRAADQAAAAQPLIQPISPTSPTILPPKPVPNGTSVPPVKIEPRPVTLPPAPPVIIETGALPTEAEIIASGRGRFLWPVRGDVVSGFGVKPGGQRNDGINLSGKDGDPVRAAAGGEVVYSGNLVPGFGNLVLIKHEGGWVTAYAHMASTSVKIKDRIAQGQTIGTVGRTGGVETPQLHFELRYAPSPKEQARPIDPALVMPR